MIPERQYETSTIHSGVRRYEIWKGLEAKSEASMLTKNAPWMKPAAGDTFTMTEEDLWNF